MGAALCARCLVPILRVEVGWRDRFVSSSNVLCCFSVQNQGWCMKIQVSPSFTLSIQAQTSLNKLKQQHVNFHNFATSWRL
jgi:hypothetical protein